MYEDIKGFLSRLKENRKEHQILFWRDSIDIILNSDELEILDRALTMKELKYLIDLCEDKGLEFLIDSQLETYEHFGAHESWAHVRINITRNKGE